MNNFLTRTLTGALFVIVMVACIWWCYWSFAILFSVIIILGLWEYYSLLEKNNIHPQKIVGIITGVLVFVSGFYGAFTVGALGTLIYTAFLFPAAGIIFFIELFRKKEEPFKNIAYTILGIIYVAFPFAILSSVAFKLNPDVWISFTYTPNIVLCFFFLVWSNDTFAYLVGRAIGRTKLFERISPKKTWEGTIGGLIFTIGTAYLISIYFKEISLTNWMIIAGIVSVTATLGDLVESMFKRSINVKDSGGILPGHGGILDRFDGVLLSAPFVCVYLLLIR